MIDICYRRMRRPSTPAPSVARPGDADGPFGGSERAICVTSWAGGRATRRGNWLPHGDVSEAAYWERALHERTSPHAAPPGHRHPRTPQPQRPVGLRLRSRRRRPHQGVAPQPPHPRRPGARQMAVPASYNDLFTTRETHDHIIGEVWYQTTVHIPRGWDGRRVLVPASSQRPTAPRSGLTMSRSSPTRGSSLPSKPTSRHTSPPLPARRCA